jgi:hypothetical protein
MVENDFAVHDFVKTMNAIEKRKAEHVEIVARDESMDRRKFYFDDIRTIVREHHCSRRCRNDRCTVNDFKAGEKIVAHCISFVCVYFFNNLIGRLNRST